MGVSFAFFLFSGALLKAAFICTQVVQLPSQKPLQAQLMESFGGGFEVHTWSKLPHGSGLGKSAGKGLGSPSLVPGSPFCCQHWDGLSPLLPHSREPSPSCHRHVRCLAALAPPVLPAGTSSILAGAVMASLYRAAGKAASTESLIHAVLHLEQRLTTGSSWGSSQPTGRGAVTVAEDPLPCRRWLAGPGGWARARHQNWEVEGPAAAQGGGGEDPSARQFYPDPQQSLAAGVHGEDSLGPQPAPGNAWVPLGAAGSGLCSPCGLWCLTPLLVQSFATPTGAGTKDCGCSITSLGAAGARRMVTGSFWPLAGRGEELVCQAVLHRAKR